MGGRPPSRRKPSGNNKADRSTNKPRAKPAPKHKQPKHRTVLSPAENEAKREERLEYDRTRSQRPERMEYRRLREQIRRQRAKALGLCRSCSNPAIPGQTRCLTCAEKHRQSRRVNDARRRAMDGEAATTDE